MIGRRDRIAAALIGLAVTGVALAASMRQGITRDEAYYMNAGEQYVQYYADALTGRLRHPFSDAAIWPYWSYNIEHPPLAKLLYGVSWRVLHRCTCAVDNQWHPVVARITSGRHTTLGLLPEVAAFRLPTAAMFGILCALVYLFFVEALGSRWGGLAAALLTAAQPRAFFHAQTAAFDLQVAALWFATTYAYWRTLATGSWRRVIATGIVFGLCLATKLQSPLLVVALAAHAAWLAWRGHRDTALAAVKALISMVVIGPLMLFAMWPWIWHDTMNRVRWFVAFHWEHVQYNFEYLGRNYTGPPYPWDEPLGMLLFTAPVVLLVLATAGLVLLLRPRSPIRAPRERSTRALMLAAGAMPVAVFMRGTLPIYGETKHWLATMPFLALAAGYALDRLRVALANELGVVGTPSRERMVAVVLVLIAFVPAAAETWHSHPYGLSHYNALAGGPPGGADLGMNRQFWGYSVKGVLPWLDANLARGATLFPHDWNHDSWRLYLRSRELRPDIVETGGVAGSDAAIVIHEKHFNEFDYRIWEEYGHVQPSQVLTLDGVPLVSVYLRRR